MKEPGQSTRYYGPGAAAGGVSPNRPSPGENGKIIVGVGDMKVSGTKGEEIITYALGSCLGITIYDAMAGVGGMLHVMLPNSKVDAQKAEKNPFMFVDTGVPRLFKACYELGAKKTRLVLKVAGGASTHGDPDSDYFQIGKRNLAMLRKLLWKNGVMVEAQDVGESHARTMSLEIGSGAVSIRSNGKTQPL